MNEYDELKTFLEGLTMPGLARVLGIIVDELDSRDLLEVKITVRAAKDRLLLRYQGARRSPR